MTIPGKIPQWLRGYLEKAGNKLGLKTNLDAQGNAIDNALINATGATSQNITINAGEFIHYPISEDNSLTITGTITVSGNLQVYEI